VRTIPRVAIAAAGVVTAGLLAGCGIADEGPRPGVAAEVGDATIKVADVEEAAEDECEVRDRFAEDGNSQPVSGARLRDNAVLLQVLREVASQLAEEYDVAAGRHYDDARAEIRRQLEGIDEDLAARFETSQSSIAYFEDILVQVGRDDLGLSESDDPGGQQAYQRGFEIAREWVERNPIETNPRYAQPVIGDDGLRLSRDDTLSTAVSGFAKDALSAAEDPQAEEAAYAATLPESQRCG
jgi:hypothetical protein